MKRFFIVVFFIVLTTIILIMTNKVFANTDKFSWNYLQGAAEGFINQGNEAKFEVKDFVNGSANVLVTIGVVIVLAGLLIVGIKYMTATPQEAAKLKSKLIGLIIAGVIILSSYAIWMFVGNLLLGIAKTSNVS